MNYDMWTEYKRWLFRLVDSRGRYTKLLDTLFHVPFRWTIDRDENRAVDGKYMMRTRFEKFMNRSFIVEELENRPCNVLEMLVALSIRMDDEFLGDPLNPRPEVWFWRMLDGLELDMRNRFVSENCRKLDLWMDRKFTYSGKYSPFPLRNPTRDQRKIEIWDQMNAWIYENF